MLGQYHITPHPLEGALQRVSRADEHIADVRQRIALLVREYEASAIAHLKANGWHRAGSNLTLKAYAPMTIGIRIGETCYNLRTALDYLVFEIAKLDSGREQDMTQFPIESSKDNFRGWVKKARRKGINAAHIAAFERLQPYKGCDWTRLLQILSNKDKHREFPKLGGGSEIIFFIAGEPDFARALPIIRAPHPRTGQEMDIRSISARRYRSTRERPS